ncbi:hypothetical protein BGZ95_009105 [Linnemannia exigua]|uniref:Uncharacterized protein n=1 Tax=Linnemannia exigua TaxID=604196 RepID=A0AAD4DFI6_9FUNG|nr:hypothetical protein BGZ95_009105 [Linnemannia exigua]
MLDIEKLTEMSRDLAKENQELKDSRMLAVSDQARTAKRLLLVSGQLEQTEQRLFDLTKERDDGQKDSALLRIERMKREALQEREDAGIQKLETLQDELQECQRSERILQQKLVTIQNKYETLTKRHDNLKRKQEELELARESKEALAWLKETTDRLCSPPQGSLGQAIQQERSSYGSAANGLHQTSPSSSPPYPSSFIDPPLAAQNQLISLIKELATTNSTLRSELNEYRDLLQDTRNEVLTLRSTVEDYEQGHAFECCASRQDDTESFRTSKSAWSALDIPFGGGLDAVSHIGTLGSIPGSPPPFMSSSSKHRHHHHRRHSGVRGNVFGELERLYSQGGQAPTSGKQKRSRSMKSHRRASQEDDRTASSAPSESIPTATTVSTSTSTSEIRRGSTPLPLMSSSRSPPNPTPSKLRHQYGIEGASPTSNTSRSRRSMYTDADLDMLESGSDSGDGDRDDNDGRSSSGAQSDDEQGPGFVAAFAEAVSFLAIFAGPVSGAQVMTNPISPIHRELALLPPATLEDELRRSDALLLSTPTMTTDPVYSNSVEAVESSPDGNLKTRTSSISLLSAELQKATRGEAKRDLFMEGNQEPAHHDEEEMHPLEGRRSTSFPRLEQEVIAEDHVLDPSASTGNKPERGCLGQHEKSSSDQGIFNTRQRRRLSEPLHHIAGVNSIPTKRSRPGSIYSIRRPRHRLESSDGYCSHLGHAATGSVGCLPELQRCKSSELVEQMMTERRQRMMEVWRVGVIEAAVTQQQSIHAVVAFGDNRKDADAISIRSKASQRRNKGLTGKQNAGTSDDKTEPVDPTTSFPSSHISESTIKQHRESQDTVRNMGTGAHEIVLSVVPESLTSHSIPKDLTQPSFDADALSAAPVFEASKPPKDLELTMEQKRRSVRSVKSFRSSIFLNSPMSRSPLLARDRRMPSEASTASEAFSNRRHDQEHSPYQLLHTLSTELLERFARSDTRDLNRRLRRTFDIQALSQMSNSVIENVLTDVSNLGERFRWVEAQVANPVDEMLDRHIGMKTPVNEGSVASGQEAEDEEDGEGVEDDDEMSDWGFSVAEFFPLTHVVQEMLSQIGKLRMTINELQLSYVLKVEEDRIKAEKDFMEGFESEEDTDLDYHHHHHHYHHRHDHHHVEEPIVTKADQAPEKPGQLKNVLGGMLDRPRMLGSASTGMSGFFNKVFGGSDKPSQDDTKARDASKSSAALPETPKDKPAMSTSKSGPVIAETSRIFAESAWISSPNKPVESKASKGTPVTDGARFSSTGGIVMPNPRLSATTSLSAMATISPARSNTVHVGEGVATSSTASTVMIRALDIRFSPNTKRVNMPHSPPVPSPIAESVKGLFSRSLPPTQPFGMLAADSEPTFAAPAAEGVTVGSFKSVSSLPEESAASANTVLVATPESEPVHVEVLSRSTEPVATSSISASRPPRTLGLSTKTSGLALNVVTKQDVFQDQWATSTSSSLSASGSMVNSDKRSTAESITDSVAPGQPYKNSSSSASLSSNSTTSEAVASLTPRLGAKPTLITRSGLTAVTPSTSTVSSPVSATSWFDTKRLSGGHTASEAARPSSDVKPQESNIFTAGFFNPSSGSGSGSGSGSTSNAPANTDQVYRKTRAVTSFHAGAGSRGSVDSVTRSLGRASGRESALAFLRGEVPASTVLNSLFSNSDTPATLPEAPSLSTATPSDHIATSQSSLKGKGLASERSLGTTQSSVEVVNTDVVDDEVEKVREQGPEQRGRSREALGIQGYITRAGPTITPSHSESGLLPPGTMSTPTTSLSQRAAVTSTAVAYVVATPDHTEDKDGSRKKRAVFERGVIQASQKWILANVQHQQVPHTMTTTAAAATTTATTTTTGGFVPQSNPRRARALSVDSAQSTEPMPANERLDLWRVGAGVSRDIWRGFIKKVDGSGSRGDS